MHIEVRTSASCTVLQGQLRAQVTLDRPQRHGKPLGEGAGDAGTRMWPLWSLENAGASGCWRTSPPGCGLFCLWIDIGGKGVHDSRMATPPESWGIHCTLFISRIKFSCWWSFPPKISLLEFMAPFSVHTSCMVNFALSPEQVDLL